jgi:hypothetical protein
MAATPSGYIVRVFCRGQSLSESCLNHGSVNVVYFAAIALFQSDNEHFFQFGQFMFVTYSYLRRKRIVNTVLPE